LRQARILMAAHVVPGTYVETALLHGSNKVGYKMITQVVGLISGAPELTTRRIDCFANTIVLHLVRNPPELSSPSYNPFIICFSCVRARHKRDFIVATETSKIRADSPTLSPSRWYI
jgi:hypothetical protein